MANSAISRMRVAVLVTVSLAGCACGGSAPKAPSAPASLATPQCDLSLWAHVYDPSRLHVMAQCQTVTGVIVGGHGSGDGDVDMPLALDPPFTNLLNNGNITKLNGDLNVEAICQSPVKNVTPDAVVACGTFKGSVTIPRVGSHVQVTGSYVLDTNHGWMEIHPATVITIVP